MSILAQIVTNVPTGTVQDIAKVLGDFGIHITATEVGQFIVSVFVIARILRKAVPDSWQNGAIGTALKHCALEVIPGAPRAVFGSPTQTTSTGGQTKFGQ